MNLTLENAISIAVTAHTGQQDKAGQPYILHPLRLMMRMETDDQRLAAVLHDAVEDSPLTIGELESLGLNGDALEAVKLLTKTVGADYEAYLVPIKQHPVARAVKIADLEDNLNVRRLKQVTEKDRERLDKYLRAHRFLSE